MIRKLPFVLLIAILLGACAPTVTLLNQPATPLPTSPSAALPPPASVTRIPVPTHVPDLGIRPDMLQGVEVVAWEGWDGSSSRLFQQMAAEFTLSNKWGIKTRVVSKKNLNLLAGDVAKSLGGQEHADIVVALPEQILAWQDQVVDLSPYIAQPEFGMDTGGNSGFFWGQSLVNGKRYGVPSARSARFLFYNTSFARSLGFNRAPSTTDEFRKQACAANSFWKQDADLTNDGYGGLALDVNANWQTPYAWLAASGAMVFVDGEYRFESPENLAALEFISKLHEDGCAWAPAGQTNYDHLAARRALFITGSLGEFPDQRMAFAAIAPADEWTVMPFPGKQPVIVAYGPDYTILKSDDARQLAAWLFIRWMLEPQNQLRWSRETGLFPVTTPAIKLFETDGAANPQLAAAMALIPDTVIYPQASTWGMADKLLADGFLAYFLGIPNANLDDVLKTMDISIKDLTR